MDIPIYMYTDTELYATLTYTLSTIIQPGHTFII